MFHTRFNVAKTKNANKVYDRHDNVDRLSYVDSTLMVNRLINEGKNLNAYRAQALRAGLYSGDMNEIINDDGIPSPVFQADPTIAMPIIEEATSRLESSVSNAAKKRSENSSIANTDSDKTNSASGADSVVGVASAEEVTG